MLVAAQLRFSPSAANLTHLLRQDDMTFLAPQAQIQLDGLLEDWACGPIKAQTPFYPFNKEGVGPPLPGASAGAQGHRFVQGCGYARIFWSPRRAAETSSKQRKCLDYERAKQEAGVGARLSSFARPSARAVLSSHYQRARQEAEHAHIDQERKQTVVAT